MLKTNSCLADTLLFTSFDKSKIVGSSSRNNRKLAKSDFIKAMSGVVKSSFLTFDNR